MKLTVWGARGSVPVSGPQYLKYGGDTTCAELVTASGDIVILDAGTGIRALGNEHIKLLSSGPTFHMLFSHAHWDHVQGFPFYKPLYASGVTLRVHACPCSQQEIKQWLGGTMRAPFFPVDLADVGSTLIFEEWCTSFEIGDLRCDCFPLNHPNQGYGYRLTEGDKCLVFIPDNELGFDHPGGLPFDGYAELFADVDLLIHDGEYLPEEYHARFTGWGHSPYDEVVRLALQAGVKRLLLWHTDQDRTDAGADELVARACRQLAAGGSDIPCEAAHPGQVIEL